ncbi:hypothetical protein Moror_14774 [Moniliophthora roreri MCA 2997]|uniref:BTB domain-containing protein n=1 Tax=Moniliophthora roreri (strain MCA 2997) TaxID=1381753 RepID=V2WNF9_MONRO|nr:hypothetical protein Moror_14774 [Moniliophthora roreri MCA 2997]
MSSPERPLSLSDDTASFHARFNSPDADITLRSLEGTLYRIPSFVLRSTSGFFDSMLSIAGTPNDHDADHPIPIPHSDNVVEIILSMLSGLEIPPLHTLSFDHVEEILNLAETWDAPGPLSIIRSGLTAPVFLDQPFQLYAVASHFGWEHEMKLASEHTLNLDLFGQEHQPALQRLPSRSLLALFNLHRARRDKLKGYLDDPNVFHAGNLPVRQCDKCFSEVDNSPWRELKARIFWEMDKNCRGDGIGSWEMEEWPETVACWSARCRRVGCGHLLYGKADTLNHLRSCMKKLPTTVEL